MISDSIIIFTDGSSRGNPGPGGWGAIVALPDEVIELGGRENDTTNNRMELTAALEALCRVHDDTADSTPRPIVVHTDSSYLINGITKWVFGWRKNGWQTKTKEPVLNRDIWEALDDLNSLLSPVWQHVAGHAGHDANERCDAIATGFADDIPVGLYRGPRAKYSVSLAVSSATSRAASVGSRSKNRNRAAYSYVSSVGGIILTHKTWAECEKRVKGAAGARYKKVFSADEEAALVKEYGRPAGAK